ncbi:gelsolin, cytoplasmic [Nilaparvata lugens]|uniref:gelsolin, cytoplasmic n=1 Tax=Nilaparvata lugens TaxID=108931 RepID=UPI00193EAFBF|nr:gelsolin, cytoplasmic [Nilaparvata lugens]
MEHTHGFKTEESDNAKASNRTVRSPEPRCGSVEDFMPDEGVGEVDVYRVLDTDDLDLLDADSNYFFSSDDCYIVKYRYPLAQRQNYVLYLWQGRDSVLPLRTRTSLLARKLNRELSGYATQVRVLQGHEPSHLRRILRGNMIVYLGNRASLLSGPDYPCRLRGTRLFQIRGSCFSDGEAIEVPAVASSLNSEDAFILDANPNTYIWRGQGCTTLERQIADTVSKVISPRGHIFILEEGQEYPDFWTILGGKLTYPHSYVTQQVVSRLTPKIYHCVVVQQSLRLDEYDHFDQHFLLDDDVSIIDTGDDIYVWVGLHASELEEELAVEKAQALIDLRLGQLTDSVVIVVRRGYEPSPLISLFPSWNIEYWSSESSFESSSSFIDHGSSSGEFISSGSLDLIDSPEIDDISHLEAESKHPHHNVSAPGAKIKDDKKTKDKDLLKNLNYDKENIEVFDMESIQKNGDKSNHTYDFGAELEKKNGNNDDNTDFKFENDKFNYDSSPKIHSNNSFANRRIDNFYGATGEEDYKDVSYKDNSAEEIN